MPAAGAQEPWYPGGGTDARRPRPAPRRGRMPRPGCRRVRRGLGEDSEGPAPPPRWSGSWNCFPRAGPTCRLTWHLVTSTCPPGRPHGTVSHWARPRPPSPARGQSSHGPPVCPPPGPGTKPARLHPLSRHPEPQADVAPATGPGSPAPGRGHRPGSPGSALLPAEPVVPGPQAPRVDGEGGGSLSYTWTQGWDTLGHAWLLLAWTPGRGAVAKDPGRSETGPAGPGVPRAFRHLCSGLRDCGPHVCSRGGRLTCSFETQPLRAPRPGGPGNTPPLGTAKADRLHCCPAPQNPALSPSQPRGPGAGRSLAPCPVAPVPHVGWEVCGATRFSG